LVSTNSNRKQEAVYFAHIEGELDSIADTDRPLFTTDVTDESKAVQYEFVCDGTRYATGPVLTRVEAYTALVRSLGFTGQTSHSIALGGQNVRNHRLCDLRTF